MKPPPEQPPKVYRGHPGIQPGDKYGKLTAIARHSKDRFNNWSWTFQCECGTVCVKQSLSVRSRDTKSCGCLTRFAESDRWKVSANAVWNSEYKDGLSFDDFVSMSQLPCHYCNREPSNLSNHSNKRKKHGQGESHASYDWRYNGLDRIDSSKDHSKENVVPCCKHCNSAKMEMSYDGFRDLIERIHKHWIRKE